MLLKVLRNIVGMVIVVVDKVTRPRSIERTAEEQKKAQGAMQGLSLYQLYACPFCIKTRRALHRLNVQIDIRDIGKNHSYRTELAGEGGRVMVPCLRIEEKEGTHWLYESDDIIAYLEKRVLL